ncbi:MAG: TylF/MycF family methyltransferase [Defluviitaleaceae bacterium]|nr:TylF/MycF family methyltransferase [Defluviitaleaceae bacterium]
MICELSTFYQTGRLTAGLIGDYYEFGVWQGNSFAQAFHMISKADQLAFDIWKIEKPQFHMFAFDSFEGLPNIEGVDIGGPFSKGDYSCSLENFNKNIKEWGVDLKRVVCTKGWYSETLNLETKNSLKLTKARIIHIDCDLYDSTKTVLEFCTNLIQDGTVIVFDDWFQFRGHPFKGEQLAFSEWQENNPKFIATEYMREFPWKNSFIINEIL